MVTIQALFDLSKVPVSVTFAAFNTMSEHRVTRYRPVLFLWSFDD